MGFFVFLGKLRARGREMSIVGVGRYWSSREKRDRSFMRKEGEIGNQTCLGMEEREGVEE